MKYSKLPQWMRDKIFLEPGGEVVTAFKYDGNPLEYWRNVGIIADAMGSYCHMRLALVCVAMLLGTLKANSATTMG